MHKFNVGDRVVYTCKDPDEHDRKRKLHAGMTGTISDDSSDGYVYVSFDNYTFGIGEKNNSTHVNAKEVIPYVPKFKVGDRVELLCEPRDNLIRDGLKVGFTGTVKRILNDNLVTVTWDNWHHGWSYEHGFNGSCYNVATNIIKLNRPKFKFDIGDVVKVSCSFSNCDNLIGKIINVSKNSFGRIIYLVEFNETYHNFHDGNISDNKLIKGSKTGRNKHCYYLNESDLVKYDKEENKQNLKFNVGDRVIIYNCLLDHRNREGKILNACKSSTGKLYYLVEMDFADPKRFHSGYSPQLNVLVGYKKGKENQCYYAGENELFLLCKAGEKEVMFVM